MSRTKKHEAPAAESAEPEVATAAEISGEAEPLKVIDIEDAVAAESLSEAEKLAGQSFFFGQIQMLTFEDGSKYHIAKHRDFITDPELIEKLKAAAQNPSNRIFPE